jgi:catechol 2,3-dioxygenase-like lactoylglutathione lyase family enzyme
MLETQPRGRSPLADAVSDSPDGVVVAQLLIVEDIERSLAFYRDVLGAIVARDKPPAMLRLHNAWLVLNIGGGPTDDKSEVTLTPPQDPNTVSGFINIRVADIEAVHAAWTAKGAGFLGAPTDRGPEIRCYLRDPDGYLIEVGQTKAPDVQAA